MIKTKKTIIIDLTTLFDQFSFRGIGRYTREVAKRLIPLLVDSNLFEVHIIGFESFEKNLLDLNLDNKYITLKEYLENNKSKHENKVFYVNNEKQQAQYINLFKAHDLDAVILISTIDNHFMQFIEMHENGITFNRIDSDLSETLKEEDVNNKEGAAKEEADILENIFKTALDNDKLKIQIESLKATNVSAMMLSSEQSRRMQEMSSMFGGMSGNSMFPEEKTLVLNNRNHLIQSIMKLHNRADKQNDVKMICEHVYDLALMSHKALDADAMTTFIDRSNKILARLATEDI